MTGEKIIQLAKKCGAYAYINAATGFESIEDIETFYHAAQAEAFEAAAKLCESRDPHPDQWSEQSEFTESRTVKACAAAIREMMEGNEK